ncbi:MAG: hypothetical protein KTR31_22210 [Myxococcales bacterium]|nr:hypothetical protein [Myxococcales bacterium]
MAPTWLLSLTLGLTTPQAHAARPQIVSIVVTDDAAQPIVNAWVRVPGTEGRRKVDAGGVWEASTLYRYDGSPLVFTKGLRLEITVTAPGFKPRRVAYQVRARRNTVPVELVRIEEQPLLPQGFDDAERLMENWLEDETE